MLNLRGFISTNGTNFENLFRQIKIQSFKMHLTDGMKMCNDGQIQMFIVFILVLERIYYFIDFIDDRTKTWQVGKESRVI